MKLTCLPMCRKDQTITSFDELDLLPEVHKTLQELSFTTPTPIQARALPAALAGRDVIGKAQTGTGKTLAFGLPLIQKMDPTRGAAQALVLLPTRELAQQVVQHLEPFARARGLNLILLVGGEKIFHQRPRIPGNQIIIGTPGRILDFLREGHLHLEWVEYLVLDEFDRMLDMGFVDDVMKIVSYVPSDRQTMLFSATIPPQSLPQARDLTKDPLIVEVGSGIQTAEKVEQRALRVPPAHKLDALLWLLEQEVQDPEQTVLVFANTRRAVAELDRELWGRGMPSAALSGDFDQSQRFKVLEGFREGRVRILIATDVASRGLDVDHVGHVINFDVPLEVEDYVHRLGRTGRAGRKGWVTTLVVPSQERSFGRILGRLGNRIRVGRMIPRGNVKAGTGDLDARPRRGTRAGGDGRRSGGSRRRAGGRGAPRGRPSRR